MIVPLHRVFERYEMEKQDSDVAAFYSLLYVGETLVKMTVAGTIAGTREDKDRHRYAQLHSIVRADGIGEWATALDALLIGPTSELLQESFRDLQRELTQRQTDESWQYKCLVSMLATLSCLKIENEGKSGSVALRQWFQWFALLRNKTRGHGATLGAACAEAVPSLERSIRALRDNLSLFKWQWAYLYRNLSGKYRVTPLSSTAPNFDYLRSEQNVNLPNGVYVFREEPLRVELVTSDADASDFFLPNGQFRNNEYELLSYCTNERRRADGSEFLSPPVGLPASETQGKRVLDLQGTFLGNLPEPVSDYISRVPLESMLREALVRDRHEIATLSGPGGVGKTSLALSVLRSATFAEAKRYDVVVWFSARDIDLLPGGPKRVQPHGVSVEDFAQEYVRLMEPSERLVRGFKPVDYFNASLQSSPIGPTLFVFDNFETVVSPPELYRWLDTYIRPPNKILITTRTREFAGDFPIEVLGMTEEESSQLIRGSAVKLGVSDLLNADYAKALFVESGGHPYVIKIMLGELARERKLVKPSRIIASQDHILQALFERTYTKLTPGAQRVFLLLCNWRSVVPALGVEAVVLRSVEERIDVRAAITELTRYSLIEELPSTDAEGSFLSVPLAAMSFGRKKLNISPIKVVIDADTELLRAFGAATKDAVKAGLKPRIMSLLNVIAAKISNGKETIDSVGPMLEFIASRVPTTWIDIARLYREQQTPECINSAKDAIRRYLETGDASVPPAGVWAKLAELCRLTKDAQGEIHALVEMAESDNVSVEELSRACSAVNIILAAAKREGWRPFEAEERRTLLGRLEARLEARLSELDATDLSRLAWLNLHIGNQNKAASFVSLGLSIDPDNEYCLSLESRGIVLH